MKRILMTLVLSLLMTVGMFTKEYTWGTTTRWNNNYPEVVKNNARCSSSSERMEYNRI